ncbi:hypothetical protein AVEN_95607-1 [Araneus ventricosus]|uniref:Uncharacterized protein n=1 Tax=Araneus ventricosus TaxID=182803 RepID=A0A4Y2FYJ7_ARAVE|nr:hypothetical protein AVEN_95607-1 [Araneus ventricosus]
MKARLLLLERKNNCLKTRLEERQAAVETLRREGILRMERIHEEMASIISGDIKRDLLDEVCARNKEDNNQLIEEIGETLQPSIQTHIPKWQREPMV